MRFRLTHTLGLGLVWLTILIRAAEAGDGFGICDDGTVESGWVVSFPTGSSDYFSNRFDGEAHTVTGMSIAVLDFGAAPAIPEAGISPPNLAMDPTGNTPDLSQILAVVSPFTFPPLTFATTSGQYVVHSFASQPRTSGTVHAWVHLPPGDSGMLAIGGDSSSGGKGCSFMTADGFAAPAIGLPTVNLAIRLQAGSPSASLASVAPHGHHMAGGSTLQVSGTHLDATLQVKVGGVPVREPQLIDATLVSSHMPQLAPGLYDVTLETASGTILDRLTRAIEVVDALLPPVQDVSAVHLRDHVSLRWSSALYYDDVRVYRDQALVATLAGSAVGYVDDLSAEAPDTAHTYDLIAARDGIDSYAAHVHAAPLSSDCWSSLSSSKLATFGRGDVAGKRLLVNGGDSNELQTAFSTQQQLDGLRIKVHAARLKSGGALKARIRTLSLPKDVIWDGIALGDLLPSAEAQWVQGVLPSTVPAGDYILGLYVAGGDPAEAPFTVTADATLDDPEPPFPCPPYPLAYVQEICGGLPPQITDIKVEVTRPIPTLWYRDQGYAYQSTPGTPSSNMNERVLTLTAVAQDVDGSIVDYRWTFLDEHVESISQSTSVTHEFPDYGFYDVMLTVTDSSGMTTSATETVAVTPYMKTSGATEVTILTDTDRCYIPHIDTPVTLEVQAMAVPASGASIASVLMQLVDSDSGAVLWTETAWSPVPGGWQAEFNMSQSNIPANADSVVLRVTATDSVGGVAVSERTICLCPMPKFTGWDHVTTTVTYDSSHGEYQLDSTFDPGVIASVTVTVGSKQYVNSVTGYATSKLRLQGHQWIGDSLAGHLEYVLMNAKHAKSYDVAPYLKFLECPDFGITYEKTGLEIFNKKTDQIEIMDHDFLGKLGFLAWGVPIEFAFWGTLKATLYAKLMLDLSITLKDLAPNLIIDTKWTPEVGLDQSGSEARLDVDVKVATIKIFTVWVAMYPGFSLQLPVRVAFSAPPPDLLIDPLGFCAAVDIDGQIGIKTWFGNWSTNRFDLYADHWGAGCPPSLAPSPPDSTQPKLPTIASSPSGATSMMMFVKETSTDPSDPRPELYYSVDRGFGWSAAAAAFAANEYPEGDPQVVFLSEQLALAVWTKNKLTQAQLDQLPQDINGLNARLAAGEIVYALWSSATGWGVPQPVTNDGLAQGMPKVAAIPGQNAAWLAWVGYDTAQVYDGSGKEHPEQTSIFAQLFLNGALFGSAVKVSTGDAGNPAADFSPDIACDVQGSACLAWVRESADLTTRNLMYAWSNGTTWGSPLTSVGRPQYGGIDMPSLALSSPGNGVLSFTALTGDDASGTDLGVADRVAYGARFAAKHLLDPEQLKAHRCSDDVPLLASWPRVLSLGGERFAVGLRAFNDELGALHNGGEIAVSVLDLGSPGASWSPARQLTADDSLNYEICLAHGAGDALRTVRNKGQDDGSGNSLVLADFSLGANPRVRRVTVGDPHTRPGSDVTVSVLLSNDGFRRAGDTSGTVQIGRIVNGQFEVIAQVPISFTAGPGEMQLATAQVRCAEEVTTLEARLIGLDDDANPSDNTASVILGVLPPTGLEAAPLKAGKHVALTWVNADHYDAVLIYRDDRLIAETSGWSEAYVDRHANPGWHSWSVRGRAGASLSDPLGAVIDFKVGVKEALHGSMREGR